MTYKEWIIGRHLVRFPAESFRRWGDINSLPNQISYANYFGGSTPIDVQAMDITETEGVEVDPEDIIQFVYTYIRNPFVRKIKPTYDYDYFNSECDGA